MLGNMLGHVVDNILGHMLGQGGHMLDHVGHMPGHCALDHAGARPAHGPVHRRPASGKTTSWPLASAPASDFVQGTYR